MITARRLVHRSHHFATRWLAGLTALTVLLFIHLPQMTSLAEAAGRKIYFYHPDHLGSTNLVTDEQGRVVQLAEYTPFGAVATQTGPTNLPHQFTGQRADASTGLYDYHARYYDPSLGRFIQPDPLVQTPTDPQTLNRYSYVRNNPLKYTDPSGHFWFIPAIIAAVKAIAVVAAAHPFIVGTAIGAVTGGINAATQGTNVFRGMATGAAMGVVTAGVNMVIPGGGTLSSNLFANMAYHGLRGAGIGAVMGGTVNSIAGGSFGQGAKTGAIGGSMFGLLGGFTSSEQFSNWVRGNKFMTNAGFAAHQSLKGAFLEQTTANGGQTYGRFGIMASGRGGYRHAGIFVEDSFGDAVAARGKYPVVTAQPQQWLLGRTDMGVLEDELSAGTNFFNLAETKGSWQISGAQSMMLNEYYAQGAGTFSLQTNCADWALGAAQYIGIQTPDNLRTFTYTDPLKIQEWLDQ